MEHSIILNDQTESMPYIEEAKNKASKTIVYPKYIEGFLLAISILAFGGFLFILNVSLWIIIPSMLVFGIYFLWRNLHKGMEITIELDNNIEDEIISDLFSRNN